MSIKIGSVSGIPLFIDYSWFIIFALIIWTVGFGLMPSSYPNLTFVEYLSIGVVSAVLLFVSIVVHELAHSILAKRSGIRIGRIALFLFGGVSEMDQEPSDPMVELKIAAAGPITSLVIAGGCWLGWITTVNFGASVLIQAPINYAALVNLIVAGFNLIPAFPMDGGRIFRAVIWKFNNNMLRSTKIASLVGRIFAYALIVFGVFLIVVSDYFDGLWLVLIGWFMSSGATSEMNQLLIQRDIAGLKAEDMMTRNVDRVSPDETLEEITSEFLRYKHRGLPVTSPQTGEFLGYISEKTAEKFEKKYREQSLHARDIMTPRDFLPTVGEEEPAQRVLSKMRGNKMGTIFVITFPDSTLKGIITRSDIVRAIRAQENILAGSAESQDYSRVLSVEKGMLFEIDSPPGPDWTPTYNSGDFSLVSERIVQLPVAQQQQTAKQFTFQALTKGRMYLTLTNPSRKKSIQYTIIVY